MTIEITKKSLIKAVIIIVFFCIALYGGYYFGYDSGYSDGVEKQPGNLRILKVMVNISIQKQ